MKKQITVVGLVLSAASQVLAAVMGSDGYADRVVVRDAGGGTAIWHVDATSAAGFGDGLAEVSGTFGTMSHRFMLGDVNGDTYVDRVIAIENPGGWWDYSADYSTSTGFGDGVVDTAYSFGGLGLIPTDVVDLNGDGRADRLGVQVGGGALEWVGNYSTPGGFTTGSGDYFNTHGAPTGHDVMGAYDLDGNGSVELVVDVGGGYWVANNGWQSSFGPGGIDGLFGDLNNDGYGDRVGVLNGIWYGDFSTSSNFGDGNPELASGTFYQSGDVTLLADVVIPEPATLGLMGLAGGGMFLFRRRSRI